MAKLSYAAVIERDQRYKMLADLGLRMDDVDAVRLLPRLVDLVAPAHLELLAESRSILGADGYWLAESDQMRRKLIRGAYRLHRSKGTPFAVKLFLKSLDMGDVRLHEGGSHKKHDATIKYRDGFHLRGSSRRWAHFQIEFLNEPIQNSKLDEIVRGISSYIPARCVLTGLKQARGALRHNDRIKRNKQHYRGQIWLR